MSLEKCQAAVVEQWALNPGNGFTSEERQKWDAKIEDEQEAIGFTGEERERLTETEYNQWTQIQSTLLRLAFSFTCLHKQTWYY